MPRRNLMDDAKLEEIRQRVEVSVASEPVEEPAGSSCEEQVLLSEPVFLSCEEQAQELVAPRLERAHVWRLCVEQPAGSRYYKWKTLRKAFHAWMWHWLE